MEIPINYLAILVAAIASMVVGFLWYGPLFGKPWSKLMGWANHSKEELKELQKKAGPAYAITFVASLVMGYVLAHNIVFGDAYVGASGIAGGMTAGFWNWLGFIVPVSLGVVLWDKKPWTLWFINAGYFLVNLLLMGAIIGGWA